MARLHYTLVKVPLGADIDDNDTSITLAAPLKEFGEDDITTISGDLLVLRCGMEIMHVTAYTSGATTATVLRGQEGSTATAHNEGDILRHVLTADDITAGGGTAADTTFDDTGLTELTPASDVQTALELADAALVALSGSISDGDKGDITVSSGGTVWTIDSGAVAASEVAFTPAGTIAATTVQAAIEEVASEAAGGGGVGWTLVVDESGASIANFTTVAGTWAADAGGYLKQTDTSVAHRGLRLTAAVHTGAGLVAQAEIRFPTSAQTDRRALLSISGTGAVTGSDMWAGLREGTAEGPTTARGDSGNVVTASSVVAEDQWYTVRVSQVGFITTISVDGTPVASYRSQPVVATDPVAADKFMLVALSGEVHFRNIKVWRLDGPA